MSQIFKFEGQELRYNHYTKTAFTTINEPFLTAGKKLGWEENTPGIGLNLQLLEFILKMKCHLVIKVVRVKDQLVNHYYWIYFDTLKQFLDTHFCDYTVSGVQLKVIFWKKFIRLQEHEA